MPENVDGFLYGQDLSKGYSGSAGSTFLYGVIKWNPMNLLSSVCKASWESNPNKLRIVDSRTVLKKEHAFWWVSSFLRKVSLARHVIHKNWAAIHKT